MLSTGGTKTSAPHLRPSESRVLQISLTNRSFGLKIIRRSIAMVCPPLHREKGHGTKVPLTTPLHFTPNQIELWRPGSTKTKADTNTEFPAASVILTARGKSPDSSDYRSFRNLTWRWFIDASGKPKTSNRPGSTPRSASRADSSRSNGPFSPRKAKNDAPGRGPADSGASRPPSGGASVVPG